jgi:hypothetical protein
VERWKCFEALVGSRAGDEHAPPMGSAVGSRVPEAPGGAPVDTGGRRYAQGGEPGRRCGGSLTFGSGDRRQRPGR